MSLLIWLLLSLLSLVRVCQVNDGSNLSGIQVVVEPGVEGWELLEQGSIATGGTAISCREHCCA